MLRRLAVIATFLASTTGCGSPYRDAIEINGIWVAEQPAPRCDEWTDPDPRWCRAVVRYAWSLAGHDEPITAAVRLHSPPTELVDGTLLTRGASTLYVVFDYPDGRTDIQAVTHPGDEALGPFYER